MNYKSHWIALALSIALTFTATQAHALSVQEISTMSAQGLAEDVLITIINNTTDLPEMTDDDVAQLQNNQVSSKVIDAILQRKASLNPNADVQNDQTDQTSQNDQNSENTQETPADNLPDTTPALPVTTSIIGDNTILAPVETSNLPIVFRKFFQQAYESYIVQAEVAKR